MGGLLGRFENGGGQGGGIGGHLRLDLGQGLAQGRKEVTLGLDHGRDSTRRRQNPRPAGLSQLKREELHSRQQAFWLTQADPNVTRCLQD